MKFNSIGNLRKILIGGSIILALLWILSRFLSPTQIGALYYMESYFLSLFVVFVVMNFLSKGVTEKWSWFSVVYIPVTAGWILFKAPVMTSAWLTSKDDLSDVFGVTYIALSILIAFIVTGAQYFRTKR